MTIVERLAARLAEQGFEPTGQGSHPDMRTLYLVLRAGLLRDWPGHRCPDCRVRPLHHHRDDCPTGAWDGGTWA